MVEELVLQALTANGPTDAGDSVYALVLPQNATLPAITYQRISSVPVNSLSGSSGLDYVRIQVDCWARTYHEAKTIAEQARTAMEAGSFKALLATDHDEFEADTKRYRASSDYLLWQK